MKIDCGEGYIGEIQQFGLLYSIDKLYGGESNGTATCTHIMDPVAPYKKPPPVVIVCSVDELKEEEFEYCEVDRRFSIGEIGEDEFDQEKRVIANKFLPEEERVSDEIMNLPYVDPNLHEVWNATILGLEIPENPDTEQDVVDKNIDPECLYDSRKDGKKASTLWYDTDSYTKFLDYFAEKCYYQSTCEFKPDEVGF